MENRLPSTESSTLYQPTFGLDAVWIVPELRAKAESFPSELDLAVQSAIKNTTAQLEKDHKFEKQLLLKDHEGEIKLKSQQIESLLAKIKDLEIQLKQAYSKAENAENNSKEITLKAIQSSGQIKIIEKETKVSD